MPGAPGAQRAPAGRGLLVAVAAAVAFAVAGSLTAYVVLKDDDKGRSTADGGGEPSGRNGGSANGGGSTGATSGAKPSSKPEPKPSDFKAINLTAGYHLTLRDDTVRPQAGEDGGYELSYDTGGYLDAESSGGGLVLLDPGQEGSLATCRAETRFAENIHVNKLATGRQVCVTTGSGHLGLVTVKGLSPEDSPSTYMTIDVTVWRNAAASSS
ncbi:hypothetical protein [Streptomyces sp. NPDC093089]|uniref:hypothetical protein n=1 Tax=Streptomyces sp. NPDC093089 TaxID=3366024 RepID=UPI003816A157